MKKIILFSAVACSMAFFACKKDSKTDTTTPTDESSAAIDPVALSAAVKIGFATSISGDLPAASADGPTLYIDGYDNRTYYAINNRYIVIYPQSDKGFVAGYYVKINGADNYFKIEYKAAGARKSGQSHGLREEGDNSDSSILIKLPSGLKGDTFSIKYAAYDTLNRVSNTITAIVNIIASKDTADNSLLSGTWRYNRYKSDYNDWSEPETYGKIDTSYQSYSCVDGKLQYCESDNCEQYPYRIYDLMKNDITFSANNLFTGVYEFLDKRIDQNTSTCSNLVYDSGYGWGETYIGGYTYNATTKVLTFIYDNNGANDYVSNLYTDQYIVSEISSTKLVYYYKSDYSNDDRTGARDEDVYINYSEYLKQ